MSNLKEWTGMKYEDLVRLAQDREQWRMMTAHLFEVDGLMLMMMNSLRKDC